MAFGSVRVAMNHMPAPAVKHQVKQKEKFARKNGAQVGITWVLCALHEHFSILWKMTVQAFMHEGL